MGEFIIVTLTGSFVRKFIKVTLIDTIVYYDTLHH